MIDFSSACIHQHSRSFLLILLAAVCANGCSEENKESVTQTPQDLNVCTSNADCAARLDGLTQCDIINRICVAPQAPVQECTNDIDCNASTDGKTQCDTALHQCVAPQAPVQECTNDTWKCAGSLLTQCISGKWEFRQTCAANTQCNAEKGSCEPNKSECKDSEHFFAGQCEADDVTHCGTHTNDCTKTSGWQDGTCIDKTCFAEECKIGYHLTSLFDSDNKEITSCTEDTHDACGSINTKCRTEEICTQGKCTDKCQPGEVICSGSCINPMTSQDFCGADASCSSYIPCSKFEKCIEGKCILSSCQNEEESLCIGKDQNECVNIHGSNLNHCGACGSVCTDKETAKTTGCNHGQCTYTCNDNMVNCGSDTDPMCLSKDQLKNDPLHCGKCDTKCAENAYCQDGQCIISACTGNECLYNNACVNEDPHCGTQCLNCNMANLASAGICQDGACIITSCVAGFHLTDKGDCEIDSAASCPNGNATGTVNCNTLEYTKAGICEEAKCKATQCQDNAHIKGNQCVADTIESCGSENNDCTQLAGWKAGTCENGKCIATTCQNGFCLNTLQGLCTNTQNDSTCGIDGGACQSCNQKQICTNGACTNKLCSGNVCNQTKDSDETLVCQNDNTHCGSNCLDCNTFTQNAVSGNCNIANGTCTVTQCDNGFHIYSNSCEKDDTNNCGVHGVFCANTVPGWKQGECQNKQCKATECQSGSHLTNQGMCESDTDTCCGTTCQNCGSDSTCIDGSCQMECLTFAEPVIGNYAFANWDTNHDGCISRSEAEAVTEIPEKAFYNNSSLNALSDLEQFPNLKTIGDSAFEGCSGLASVSLPQATHIGDSAFKMGDVYCESFEECFGNDRLKSVSLPKATHIGNAAFAGCMGLASIDLPLATHIGNDAFMGTSLTSVSLPKATHIGNAAFSGGIRLYECGNDCNHFPYKSYISNTSLKSISLPQATEIGDSAFAGCMGIASIDLPQATYIGNYAFMGTSPTSVSLPKATFIGNYAFAGSVSEGCGEDEMWSMCGRFYLTETIHTNNSLASIDFPQATHIGTYAFAGRTGLKSVSLPQATSIGDYAFLGGGTAADYDSGVAEYEGTTAIVGNKNLTFIDLPLATEIGRFAFYGCTGLTSIDLPQATSIGDHAFFGCTGLTSIDLPQVTSVGNYAFMNAFMKTSPTSVSLPKATEIGEEAFYGCKGLTSIDLPQVTEISFMAFLGCTGLAYVSLPKATSIGNAAFSGCTSLTSVSLPQATKIGPDAFDGCTGLISIDLPKATSIRDYAFSGCTGLSSIALTSPDKIALTNTSLESYEWDTHALTLDKVTLTLHQNKAVGGSSSPLCTSATEWGGKTWKEIKFVQ